MTNPRSFRSVRKLRLCVTLHKSKEFPSRIIVRDWLFNTIVLTCLNRKTVASIREFVGRGERSNFYFIGGSGLQRPVTVTDLVVAILAADREIFHGAVLERIVRLHHLRIEQKV